MSKYLNHRFAALAAYVPGEQPQDRQYVKLNTNESPFRPSPLVIAALAGEELARLNLYPDPEGRALKERLAARFSLSAENVFIANGSDEILSFAFMALFADGVAFPDLSYGFYPVYAALYNVEATRFALMDDFSVAAAQYCTAGRNVVLANPNAPTGLALSLAEIRRIVASNPEHVVLIDEAYVDFGAESCAPLVKEYDNLLVVQTFSKSRSLAGARLGFALAHPELIADLEKIKYATNPYNVNRLTQTAGVAALADEDYFRLCVQSVIDCRAYTTAELRRLGCVVLDSRANFIFAKHPGFSGEELYRKLKKQGVLVRYFAAPRCADYVRISIGVKEQMDALISAMERIVQRIC